jgi:rhomboid protease GluP
MSEMSESALRVAPRRELAEEWALALVAEGLSPSVSHVAEGFLVSVPIDESGRAAAVLGAYDSENVVLSPPQLHFEAKGPVPVLVALGVAIALLDFFFVVDAWKPLAEWRPQGSADAQRILAGELWRTVTALTLHANLVHVLANAVGAAIFLTAVCRALGAGLGCALVLLTGVAGNLLNAFWQGPLHVSVGASTAVFGAVGMLGGLGVVRRRRKGLRGRYAWVPVAAGLALVGMLGTAGERTDLWAHLFGFLIGAGLGLAAAFTWPRPPVPRIQWALGASALALVVLSWFLALR